MISFAVSLQRSLYFENLERRDVCASWQNFDLPCDVDGSDLVTPLDVLSVIDMINRDGPVDLTDTPRPEGAPFVDVNGDNLLSSLDPLAVIDAINKPRTDLQVTAGVSLDSDPNSNSVVLGNAIEIHSQSFPGALVSVRRDDQSPASLPPRVASDESGKARLRVPIEFGLNRFQVTARDELGRTATKTLEIRRGDVFQDWNAAALNIAREWAGTSNDPFINRIVPSQPPMVARNLAMIHIAMLDTMNSFSPSAPTYLGAFIPPANADPQLASVSAARTVASALYSAPDEIAVWNASLAEAIMVAPTTVDIQASIEFGKTVGARTLEIRSNDGSTSKSNYIPGQVIGQWNRTPTGFLPPLLPQWGNVTPFILSSPSQFRPAAPPDLSSPEYAAAVDEVLKLGGLVSMHRTQEQTEIATFWADGAGTFTPPGHWNQIASDVASQFHRTPSQNAEMFALLNIGLADAAISCWDAKYHYDLWRPVSAIRRAEESGLPDYQVDDWLPFLQTPPFPAYTSGHSTFSGAAATILTGLFGEHVAFTSRIDGQNAPSQKPLDPADILTRSFSSFTDAAKEASVSRIYGGIHFRFDCDAGLQAGERIGAWVLEQAYKQQEA